MKIGLLGTGLMGAPMALRLQACGHEVAVYNRTAEKLQPLIDQGLTAQDTPADLLQACEATIFMVSDAGAIAALLSDPDTAAALRDRTLIQMGTIAPNESRDIASKVEQASGAYLESPVLGSIPQAKDGSLILMVGSTPEQFRQWQPVLQCFGEQVILLGPVGSGAAVKLAMNQLIGSLTAAFSLSLGLVQREHIDLDAFMDIVRHSALYAPTFDKKLDRMVNRNFENPNFPTKHLLKDMQLFSQAATTAGLSPELTDTVAALVERAIAQGLADKDYSALYSAVNPSGEAD